MKESTDKREKLIMKRRIKYLSGFLIWFGFGLMSITLGWTHIVTYVISAYLYLTFVEPHSKDEPRRKRK